MSISQARRRLRCRAAPPRGGTGRRNRDLSGVGFDVIPTDCIAAVLKEALSDATHLVLAFDAEGPMSPRTARTLVDPFDWATAAAGYDGMNMIEEVPLAHYWRRIDFAGGSGMAIAIPWGDLATAGF